MARKVHSHLSEKNLFHRLIMKMSIITLENEYDNEFWSFSRVIDLLCIISIIHAKKSQNRAFAVLIYQISLILHIDVEQSVTHCLFNLTDP